MKEYDHLIVKSHIRMEHVLEKYKEKNVSDH